MLWRPLLCFSKPWLLPVLPPPQVKTYLLSLRELFVCRCIHVYACAPARMACMHICVASQCIKRNTPCVAFSSLYRASPLSHVIMENPTASHTSDKTQSPVWIVQRLRNSAEDWEIYPREWTCFDTQPKSLTKHKAQWFIFFGLHCV